MVIFVSNEFFNMLKRTSNLSLDSSQIYLWAAETTMAVPKKQHIYGLCAYFFNAQLLDLVAALLLLRTLFTDRRTPYQTLFAVQYNTIQYCGTMHYVGIILVMKLRCQVLQLSYHSRRIKNIIDCNIAEDRSFCGQLLFFCVLQKIKNTIMKPKYYLKDKKQKNVMS